MFWRAGFVLVGVAFSITGCAAPERASQPLDGGGKPASGGVLNTRSPNDPNSWGLSQR